MADTTRRDLSGTVCMNLQAALGQWTDSRPDAAFDSLELAASDLDSIGMKYYEAVESLLRMAAGDDAFDEDVIQSIIDQLTVEFGL